VTHPVLCPLNSFLLSECWCVSFATAPAPCLVGHMESELLRNMPLLVGGQLPYFIFHPTIVISISDVHVQVHPHWTSWLSFWATCLQQSTMTMPPAAQQHLWWHPCIKIRQLGWCHSQSRSHKMRFITDEGTPSKAPLAGLIWRMVVYQSLPMANH